MFWPFCNIIRNKQKGNRVLQIFLVFSAKFGYRLSYCVVETFPAKVGLQPLDIKCFRSISLLMYFIKLLLHSVPRSVLILFREQYRKNISYNNKFTHSKASVLTAFLEQSPKSHKKTYTLECDILSWISDKVPTVSIQRSHKRYTRKLNISLQFHFTNG